ncbi:MAG: hypothetical protein NZ805_15845 [Armatimonadetes bacterium]|nr:hypothetical protein [Armatimonadota bacterium]MDW8028542.1 hypothetical protein [Armatimonadota bacterium]
MKNPANVKPQKWKFPKVSNGFSSQCFSQLNRPPTKTMEEWRQYYEQKIKPSPVPGQYKAPVKPVP